jgi:hypothetical protein
MTVPLDEMFWENFGRRVSPEYKGIVSYQKFFVKNFFMPENAFFQLLAPPRNF